MEGASMVDFAPVVIAPVVMTATREADGGSHD
jgi:hypothetical protein